MESFPFLGLDSTVSLFLLILGSGTGVWLSEMTSLGIEELLYSDTPPKGFFTSLLTPSPPSIKSSLEAKPWSSFGNFEVLLAGIGFAACSGVVLGLSLGKAGMALSLVRSEAKDTSCRKWRGGERGCGCMSLLRIF